MARSLGSSPWLSGAGIVALALLLSGSYCSWRGYYVPGSLQGGSTQTTIGPVGAFASVFVDGTEFADSGATITIDGVAASESELLVGQVATVGGAQSSATVGSASTLAVTTKLVGPVEAIDLAAGTVTVLGQTVAITGDTSVGPGIAPTDVGGLGVGELVAVDGYRTTAGLIASRFDLAVANRAFQVAGPVANLDGAALTFTIAGSTIDYSAASGGLPAQISDGSYVVVSGGTVTAPGTLRAALISAQAEVPTGSNGAGGSVHGTVTRYGSATDFDVGGQTVATSATTTYAGGVSTDVGPDVELEVGGSYDANGVLDATTVTLVPATNVRVAGPVAAIDAAGLTLTVNGVTLGTGAETRWDDRSAAQLRTFGFANLQIGDWVIVRGAAAGGASASGRVVERWPAPSPALAELQDVASAVASPQFTLTGVTVAAVGATFTDVNGASLTPAQFFGQAAGRVVRARGTMSGATLVATTVALRD
ncbi:MAG TPA: DUF5666 domain-containing protein [Steroidobacteraceae bacterium]|nr:DUF5666 domain-containing protein [Steroidobacteraceae bacterium]